MSSPGGPSATSRTPLLAAHRSASPHAPAFARNHSVRPFTTPASSRRRPSTESRIRLIPSLLALLVVLGVAFIAWDVSSYGDCYVEPVCRLLGNGRERSEEVWWRNSGAYAPWRSLGPGGGSRGLPRGCKIDQVTVLQRHAARFPTTSAGKCMHGTLDKLKRREITKPSRHPELAFLANADMDMSGWRFDNLMDQGRRAAWRSGKDVAAVYRRFLETSDGIFSRSSGGSRVVETAGYWLEGFNGEPFKMKDSDALPKIDVVIPEDTTSNNTLSVHSCPAFDALDPPEGSENLSSLLKLLEPPTNRLNSVLRPRPRLDPQDILCLADMCPFDSQAEGEGWQAWSRWCRIFSADEWEAIGHVRDARRYYEVGQGSLYGKTMGAGWINELLARLTDTAPQDSTCTNRTLDSDASTFPPGGKKLFVDFGHDNEIIEVLTAMGVITEHRPPSVTDVPDKRTFLTSNLIPFGSRVIFERIACDLGSWEPDPDSGDGGSDPGKEKDGRKDYVRILVNDKLRAVDHIACKQSGFVEHFMCELEGFVESQVWASEQVDWGICFRNVTTAA